MTDILSESLDQQLLKIQSAKDHLLRTRQLFDEVGSAELKTSDAKFAELIDALDADLKEVERKKAQQQAAALAEQEMLRREGELTLALSQLAEAQSEITRLRQLNDEQSAEQTKEAELLLEQLHLVQEEFESLYLKSQADKSASEQQLAQLNAQLQQEQSAKSAAEQNAAQQAAKLTAELEQVRAAKSAAERNATQQAAKLTAELEQVRAAKTAAYQNAALQAEQVQKQLEESQQETELLLLQLHQVQEELEQHFLDKKKLQRECETLQQRWERLERRLPGYIDYELIEPVTIDTVSDLPRIDWRIANLTVMGRLHPELAFSTLLKDGQAGIVLDGIELFPRALRGPEATTAIQQFRRFGSRQWRMVLATATALEQFFAGDPDAIPQLSFDPVFWRQALLPLVADLRALPVVFRFDGVKLKRELVNPDYEHLWLVLEGASLGSRQWPKFELRLGAADIRRGHFSRHPKLEFPLIDGKTRPFDSWYEESHDDFGGKFELRFDIDRKLMDLGVWSKLSVDDRKLLLSVNGVLGPALQHLQAEQSPISRAWSDWQGLVTGILATLHKLSEVGAQQQKTQVRPVPAPAAPIPLVEAPVASKAPAKKAAAKKPAAKKTATRKLAAS